MRHGHPLVKGFYGVEVKTLRFERVSLPTPMNRTILYAGFLTCLTAALASAQLGDGWKAVSPKRKIHLADENGLKTFDWSAAKSIGTGPALADYSYDAETDTETFRLLDKRSNRAEIRLRDNYTTGSRQFEAYVSFDQPLDDLSLMQIWGSTDGATQLMLRGFAAKGGEIRKSSSKVMAAGVHGKEIRVNVIHLQEDCGNKILVFIDGVKKLEIPDSEAISNYFKYGCYGTLKTGPVAVKWRKARYFAGGREP